MIEIDLFVVLGSKMTGFCVGVEVALVCMWVVEINLIVVWGIEIDLISVQGSELPLFFCRGRK